MTPWLVAISDRKAWPMESESGKGWNSLKNSGKDGFQADYPNMYA